MGVYSDDEMEFTYRCGILSGFIIGVTLSLVVWAVW